MQPLKASITIGAQDQSQGAIRSVLSGLGEIKRVAATPIVVGVKLARGGLALARDINLGLAPIVRGLGDIIDRGAELETTQKSFASLTGRSADEAAKLARRLRDASHGTLTIARAMQLANRAIAAGIDIVRDLPVILDFASKKAMTTGMSFNMAMDRIIMGLSRGSPAILDDFGLMNDGLQGVKETYDRINGAGAFEHLGPAAQKAETVRQAMRDIEGQLGRIGVTGRESAFVFASIKNNAADTMDRLMLAVGRSESLRKVLTGVRDVMLGIAEHLEKGGSVVDVLAGKKDEKTGKRSGGLLGIGKAAVFDLGDHFGRGALYVLIKGVGGLVKILAPAFGWVVTQAKSVWTEIKQGANALWAKIKAEVPSLWKELPGKIEDGFKLGVSHVKAQLKEWFPSLFTSDMWKTPPVKGTWKTEDGEKPTTVKDVAKAAATTVLGQEKPGDVSVESWGDWDCAPYRRPEERAGAKSEKPWGVYDVANAAVASVLLSQGKPEPEPDGSARWYHETYRQPGEIDIMGHRRRQWEQENHLAPSGSMGIDMKRLPAYLLGINGPVPPVIWHPTPDFVSAPQGRGMPHDKSLLAATLGMQAALGIAKPDPEESNRSFVEAIGSSIKRAMGSIFGMDYRTMFAGLARDMDRLADEVIKGGGGRTGTAVAKFLGDFPVTETEPDGKKYPLTQRGMMTRQRRIYQIDREIKLRESGGRGVRQRAIAAANRRIRELRGSGHLVRPQDERDIRKETFDRMVKEATRKLREEKAKLEEAIKASKEIMQERREKKQEAKQKKREEAEGRQLRGSGKSSPTTTAPATSSAAGGTTESGGVIDALARALQANTAAANQVFAALTGANAKLTQTA